ncbi:MAG: adenine phosphoribosyltransferase [Planctomycetes bacterium]|nr:adenine phosphoribosyltransferase [Planctomycetota bacterium]
MEHIAKLIRDVPDFPKPGILFKDFTPLLANPQAMAEVYDAMAAPMKALGVQAVLGIESRGFILGTPIADRLGVPFAPVRKPGKLPAKTVSVSYTLEYGEDTLELHEDAIQPGTRVAIVDDLLATGGTLEAACRLAESIGAEVVTCSLLIELSFLKGRERLKGRTVQSLIQY